MAEKSAAPVTRTETGGMKDRLTARRAISTVLAMALVAGCQANPDDGDDWPTYGGSGENHFSALEQINDSNVNQLGLAWHYDIQVGPSSLSAPIEVGGVLYFVGGQAVVHALDATTGKLLWQYDPEVWKHAGDKLRGAWGTRGIAYDDGKLFVGTLDGRLIAIDARGGNPVWTAQTTEKDDGRVITGAPWVFDGKVAIGHGGADSSPVRGYVTAYDQRSGKQLWRFFTVPGDPAKGFENEAMAMAAKTWTGEWWKFGGGGTAWNAMAYDPRFDRLYIGTGNGSPWNQKVRSPGGGDNLFLCSIVALDAKTGKYIWHYQVNPGETWDFNAAMDMALADLKIDGKTRPVLMTAPKNGFFYVLDRENGKLLSAAQIAPVNWASHIDLKTGRPVEKPEARFPNGKAAIVWPASSGAHSIEAMSFNDHNGIAYIPITDKPEVYIDPPGPLDKWRFTPGLALNTGTGAAPDLIRRKASSTLLAWDPVRQKALWEQPLPGFRSFGGTMATAGNLLFAGDATGRFSAYHGATGRKLWSFDAQTSVTAQPISYRIKGRQYVSVIAGARSFNVRDAPRKFDYRAQRWRLLTFALGGADKLPPATVDQAEVLDDSSFTVDPARAARGAETFTLRCFICHGAGAIAGGAAPNLLTSPVPLDGATFGGIVRDGALQMNGMPRFADLAPSDLKDLQHYLRQRAREEVARTSRTATNRPER